MSWFDYDEYEERNSRLATPSEAVAEYGRNAGAMFPDRAWLLHDWDVWVKNPHYAGPPVPHPESDWEGPYEEEGVEPPGFDDPKSPEGPVEFDPGADYSAEDAENLAEEARDKAIRRAVPDDDEIPF